MSYGALLALHLLAAIPFDRAALFELVMPKALRVEQNFAMSRQDQNALKASAPMTSRIDFNSPAAGFDQPLQMWLACHERGRHATIGRSDLAGCSRIRAHLDPDQLRVRQGGA